MLKIINSITFAETDVSNETGEDFPIPFGHIYNVPERYTALGQRLAIMLSNNRVKLVDQDNITIVFSSYIDEGHIQNEHRLSADGSHYITIGVDPVKYNSLNDKEKINTLLQLSEKTLCFLDADKLYKDVIKSTIETIQLKGENIDLLFQSKSDQKISVDLILKIFDNGNCSIRYLIKDIEGNLIQTNSFENAHCLSVAQQKCGSILIRKNKVIIKPQKNILCKDLAPIEIDFKI